MVIGVLVALWYVATCGRARSAASADTVQGTIYLNGNIKVVCDAPRHNLIYRHDDGFKIYEFGVVHQPESCK